MAAKEEHHWASRRAVVPDRGSQLHRACGDCLHILGSPEHEIDRVEGWVPEARRRVDRNQATLLPAIEDVVGVMSP